MAKKAKTNPMDRVLVEDKMTHGDINRWVILSLDPSLSRTGYAISEQRRTSPSPWWARIGSIKPDSAKDLVWVRSTGMSLFLKDTLLSLVDDIEFEDTLVENFNEKTGLIISMEFPTPMNDYLVSINRIINAVLLSDDQLYQHFNKIYVLYTNAATLRSVFNLKAKGNNKKENIERAYEHISKHEWPGLDSDACDAVLLGLMGQAAAQICLGQHDIIPDKLLLTLADSLKVTKGSGNRERVETKGLMHNPNYWARYERMEREYVEKDARTPSGKRLRRVKILV